MKRIAVILLSCAFLTASCVSLDFHWSKKVSSSVVVDELTEALVQLDVPRSIARDFAVMYRGARNVTARPVKEGDIREYWRIDFTSAEGLSCTAYYMDQRWSVTQSCLDKSDFVHLLPRLVLESYLSVAPDNADYINYNNGYAVFIDRADFDRRQFEFSFVADTDDCENLVYHIVIADDGTILETSHHSFNNSIWYYNIEASLNCLKANYRGYERLGMVNDGGDFVYYIRLNGTVKKVRLRPGTSGDYEIVDCEIL